MKGRQKGRPTKWVLARLEQTFVVDKAGMDFVIWSKWKRNQKRLGTLTISVGGLRWRPAQGRGQRRRSWNKLAEWFDE